MIARFPKLKDWVAQHGALTIVLVAVAALALVRFRLGTVPLERDEGEYAYAGQLILRGIPPYTSVYNMKFPGTYYATSLILAIFGETPLGIHTGLLLVNAATTFLVFAIARRIGGEAFAAVAAIAFGVLSVDRCVMGVFAHATHFVLLPALASLLLLLRDPVERTPRHVGGAGVLLGIAVLMKQHAVLFLPLAAGLLVAQARADRARGPRAIGGDFGALMAGAALPFLGVGALFTVQGVFGAFWFWTIRYAAAYVTEVPISAAPGSFGEALAFVTLKTRFFWLAAAAGLVALWATPWGARARIFVTGLLAASFLAMCPGFYFRPHYFILLLPALAFLVGVAVVSLARVLRRVVSPVAASALAATVFAAVTVSYAWPEREYLFTMSPPGVSRSVYGVNPFNEAPMIAEYIRERTEKDDRIAVLGSEPEIFFYANRRSASSYIYTYALVEGQPYARQMQDEMIRQIQSSNPKYLVFVEIDPSWLVGRQSNIDIVEWGNRYARSCFDLVGIADMNSLSETTMLWDQEAAAYTPVSRNVVYTFRRKNDQPCTIMP